MLLLGACVKLNNCCNDSARISCLERTCVQFPPVDLAEEGVSPELVTRAVLEAEPLVRFFHQQTLADGPSLLTELLRIYDWIVQDPLLHHLILHLREQERFLFYSTHLKPANQVGPAYLRAIKITLRLGSPVRLLLNIHLQDVHTVLQRVLKKYIFGEKDATPKKKVGFVIRYCEYVTTRGSHQIAFQRCDCSSAQISKDLKK